MDVVLAIFGLVCAPIGLPFLGYAVVLYLAALWLLLVLLARTLLPRALPLLARRLAGLDLSIGSCCLRLDGGGSIKNVCVVLPQREGGRATVVPPLRLEVASVTWDAPMSRLLDTGFDGLLHLELCGLRVQKGMGQQHRHRSGGGGTGAVPLAPTPATGSAGDGEGAQRSSLSSLSRLLAMVRLDVRDVSVVLSGWETELASIGSVCLILPEISVETINKPDAAGCIEISMMSPHPLTVLLHPHDESPERAEVTRLLRLDAFDARVCLAAGCIESCHMDCSRSLELYVNAAAMVAMGLARQPKATTRPAARADNETEATNSIACTLSIANVSFTVALRSHVLAVVAVNNQCKTKSKKLQLTSTKVSAQLDGHQILAGRDVRTGIGGAAVAATPDAAAARGIESSEVRISTYDMHIDFPNEISFGMIVTDMLEEVNAIRLALFRRTGAAAPAAPAADEATWRKAPVILFECEGLTMSVADDPLDTWLNQRYLLIRDEWHERAKRWKILKQQLAYLQAAHGASLAQVRQAEQQMEERSELIYRDRVIEASVPAGVPAPLLAVRIGAIELRLEQEDWACSRDGLLGRVAEYGGELSDSAADGCAFTELVGRRVTVDVRDTTVQIRNFAKPLVAAGLIVLEGPLVAAEQSVSSAFHLHKACHVGQVEVIISKTLAPMKLFHALNCSVRGLDIAYGTATQPGISDAAEALARLTPLSLDPASPMPWWDKLRFKLHGELVCTVSSFHLLLMKDNSPHVAEENVSIDITQLELGLAGQSQWTVDASDLRVKLNSAMHSDESGSLKDSLYLPAIKVGMLMKWISGHESHFVHPFARSGDEAFPNKAVAQPKLHTDIGDRWWGPVLAPDAHEAVGGVFPTDTFISTGWTLKIDVCVSDNAINNTGQRSSHARHTTLRLFVASLGWLSKLARQLGEAAAERFDPRQHHEMMMKMPLTKLNVQNTSLGGLLLGADFHFEAIAPKLMLWNVEDVCLEASAVVAACSMRVAANSSGESEATVEPQKEVGMHIVADAMSARWLVRSKNRMARHDDFKFGSCGQFSFQRNTIHVPVEAPVLRCQGISGPVESPSSTKLLEQLLGSASDRDTLEPLIATFTNGSATTSIAEPPTHGMAATATDMLMWCSVDSRNALYDFLMAFQSDDVTDAEMPDAHSPGGNERDSVPTPSGAPKPDSDHLASIQQSLAIRFVRPQIRLETEQHGCVFVTSHEASID
eukprot:SAG25_NODE_1111_length_3929_cov_2.779634_1_plen_1220_part_10